MTRNTVGLIVGAALAYFGVALGGVPHAQGEPLITACPTSLSAQHRTSCSLGYTAMYMPKRTAANCQGLYERDAAEYGRAQFVFQSDYMTGCEAAKKELITEGY